MLLKDILVGQSGRTTVSRVFQRTERGGYYLGVPVPNELRKKLKKSELVRKLGNTYKEANIKRHQVEAKVQREFGAELNKLSLVEEVTTMYESDKNFKGMKSLAEIPEKESLMKQLKNTKREHIHLIM